ncbi:hypothetical protein Ga0451573_003805 [Peptococcaceae bacterium DYL19]|nr:hypothetical protein [Phosphitispora fastidiosa]
MTSGILEDDKVKKIRLLRICRKARSKIIHNNSYTIRQPRIYINAHESFDEWAFMFYSLLKSIIYIDARY